MSHFPSPSRALLAVLAVGSMVVVGVRAGGSGAAPGVVRGTAPSTLGTAPSTFGTDGSPGTDGFPGAPAGTVASSGTDASAPAFLAPPPALSGIDPLASLEPLRAPAPAAQQSYDPGRYHDFYFTRAVYSGGGLGRGFFGGGSWAVDFPKADRQFLVVLGETLDLLNLPSRENAVRLEDPMLRRFPFLYTLEVGGMYLNPAQVEGLRSYLLAGGFLVVDDFWGAWEWRNFEDQMRRVLPGAEIVDLPLDHEIFHVFYDIEEILQVPNVNNARRGVTSECGPCRPAVRGIFDEDGRLMVVINWNTDLGDAWEWSEQPDYPFTYSNYAYKMAVNFIVYAMTH